MTGGSWLADVTAIITLIGSLVAAVLSFWNKFKLDANAEQMNGHLGELISTSKKLARAQGIEEEKERGEAAKDARK